MTRVEEQVERADNLREALLSDAVIQALYCHAPNLTTDNDAGPNDSEEASLRTAMEAVYEALTEPTMCPECWGSGTKIYTQREAEPCRRCRASGNVRAADLLSIGSEPGLTKGVTSIPVSDELRERLKDDWSEPIQIRIEDGDMICRTVGDTWTCPECGRKAPDGKPIHREGCSRPGVVKLTDLPPEPGPRDCTGKKASGEGADRG